MACRRECDVNANQARVSMCHSMDVKRGRGGARTIPLGENLCALPRAHPSRHLTNPLAHRLTNLRLEGARRAVHYNRVCNDIEG